MTFADISRNELVAANTDFVSAREMYFCISLTLESQSEFLHLV